MRIVYTINCLLFILFTSLPSRSQTGQGIKLVSPSTFKTAYQNTNGGKVLLDVRTPSEYAKAHLKDAVLIDIFRDDFNDAIQKLDRNQPIFVYCAVGGRSAEAAEILQKAGFKIIYDLDGGIKAWQKENLPLVSQEAK